MERLRGGGSNVKVRCHGLNTLEQYVLVVMINMQRSSDSLNQDLPTKMAAIKVVKKTNFPLEWIAGLALKLSPR